MKNYTGSKYNDKRDFRRYEIKLQISLFHGNLVYSGIVTNLSESGMFITTKRCFPIDTMLVTTLMLNDNSIQVPVRISRIANPVKTKGLEQDGLGVKILRSSRDYLDFLDKNRSQQMKLSI